MSHRQLLDNYCRHVTSSSDGQSFSSAASTSLASRADDDGRRGRRRSRRRRRRGDARRGRGAAPGRGLRGVIRALSRRSVRVLSAEFASGVVVVGGVERAPGRRPRRARLLGDVPRLALHARGDDGHAREGRAARARAALPAAVRARHPRARAGCASVHHRVDTFPRRTTRATDASGASSASARASRGSSRAAASRGSLGTARRGEPRRGGVVVARSSARVVRPVPSRDALALFPSSASLGVVDADLAAPRAAPIL